MSQYLKICLLLAVGLVGTAAASAEEIPLGPRPGVLLLRNGRLVAGDILLAGDRYDVAVAGGQIHIKRGEVEYFGRSVLDCYERRKTQVEPGKVQDILELADWCLRLELYEQAALALAEAIDTDAQHPRIAVLERRLKLALEQRAATTPKNSPPSDAPSIQDLDRTIGALPPGAVETFTTAVQPVLMNHCSTAGCHGPHSGGSLELLRITAGHTPSRRATQRNLYAVLQLVDRDQPGESPLLVVP
ncbi:MAG TPA: hypothetical protein VG433_09430, partial [Pirellulales bacterium]|nr:hypothetical protein [Pirellulales bacterium]